MSFLDSVKSGLKPLSDTFNGIVRPVSDFITGNDVRKKMAEDTFNANQQSVQEQRKWLEHMSNTAVQRRMQDLKKAGINPHLAAGSAASTPGSGFATKQAPNMQGFLEISKEARQWFTSAAGIASKFASKK